MRTPRFARLLLVLALLAGCSSPSGSTADPSAEEATVHGQVLIRGRRATSGTIVSLPQEREPIEAPVQPDGTDLLRTFAGTNLISVKGSELETATANMPPQMPQDVRPDKNRIGVAC
jgi:hypothetical protein